MKHTAATLGSLLLLAACQPDPFKEIGPDYSLVEGITGTWMLSGMDLTDETQPVPETQDVGNPFLSDPMTVQFDYNAGTYQVTDPGYGSDWIGNVGSFAFNNAEFPSAMSLYPTGGDTILVELTQMVRSIDVEMGFKLRSDLCGDANLTYTYSFSRQ
ncbi:hypothetical protein GC167_06350 [bacterium]|nr:hypothetical protein [bacterium]